MRRGDLVSLIDVAPTVLDMAGLPVPEGLDGRSLLREVGEDRTLFAETIRMAADVRTARRGRYKLIETPYRATSELYDLASDPLEQEPLESDPTNGELGLALAEYRAATESGWHLKVIALGMRVIRLRGEIRTTGRLVEPRHYVSESIHGRSAEIRRFRVGGIGGVEGQGEESGDVLELDIQVANHVLENVFDTDPPDAPVTFDLAMTDVAGSAGMFIGRGERLRVDGPISLDRDDPRLAGEPANYWASTPGVYIRAVNARRGRTEPVELSKQVREHLEALGYGATEPD